MNIIDNPKRGFISVTADIAAAAGPDGLTVGEIVDRLDERAFGLLILALTIPCLVPGLPGAQIIAIPIFLLAMQMVLAREEPWLPRWFLRQRVGRKWLEAIAGFCSQRLGWTERLARPRLSVLADGPGGRLAALIMALAAITIMLPITNTIPSLALTLLSVGLLQRDGLFVAAGAAIAAAWVSLLGALLIGLVYGAGFAVEWLQGAAPWLVERLRPGA